MTLGFSRLAREPVGPSQVTLLISLTAGLTFFASAFTYSVETWQENMARYLVGTDIRLNQPMDEQTDLPSLAEIPGITATTQVIRAGVTFLLTEYERLDLNLLAVDPESFTAVVTYPPGISRYSIAQILGTFQTDSHDILPVVISSNAKTRHLDIGDQLMFELAGETYPVEIVGIIINFPLVGDMFAITDSTQFTRRVDTESLAVTDQGTREIWMAVDPNAHETVIAGLVQAGFGDSIVGNSQTQLDLFQNNLVFREVVTAFELNALVLIPLSVVGFTLILMFSARRREGEFSVLQAMGLSKIQLRGLLLLEGLIFVTLGFLIGIGIGLGLSTLMQPFLAQILPPLGDGFVLSQMLVDWPDMSLRFAILMGFYGVGILVLIVSAIRNPRSADF
jgi:hypothetical protein